jgi:ferritin heavy chain
MIRQNFTEECEALINKQINMELYASYVYLSMSYHFHRDDQALLGFAKFFKKNSDEEREHAQLFMEYQNKRGGSIVLQGIEKPSADSWGTAVEAVAAALALEKEVNQSLLNIHKVADPHLCDFLETHFLEEQVKAIKELSDMLTQMKRAGEGLGLHIIDRELLD